ncbi:MAG: DinB family protein [Flaviaesturariibacter sp.]|nr:DinB family protein [Flaviaesturariibacter sp.]
MNSSIESIRKTRTYLLTQLDGLTTTQFNIVPEGFNNNIAWNLGHLVAAEQGVCYMRGGLKPVIDPAFFERYKPGSRPDEAISEEAITEIKSLMMSTLDRLQEDYDEGAFAHYTTWTTRYGTTLASIDEALAFLLFHEGFHGGICLALKKIV